LTQRVIEPAPGADASVQLDASGGVAVVTFDHARSAACFAALAPALERAFGDPSVRAVVLRSARRDVFATGPSVERGDGRPFTFARDAEAAAREVASRLSWLAAAPKPVVAWVEGAALGSGFELALACTAAVAGPTARVGLPDVHAGRLPGGNGVLRVAERAGLAAAIDLALGGRRIDADEALRRGLVDMIVDDARGLGAARALALRLAAEPRLARRLEAQRRRRAGHRLQRLVADRNPVGRALLVRRARRALAPRSRSDAAAASRIVELVAVYGARGFHAAAEHEARLFGELVVGEGAHRLEELAHAEAALEAAANEAAATPRVAVLGVVGAGPFGSRLAAAAVEAGLVVEREALARAEVVVDASADDRAHKMASLDAIEAAAPAVAAIAVVTWTLPLAHVAATAAAPSRVVAIHPGLVRGSRLVELVRAEATDPRAAVAVEQLLRRLGHVVVVVEDTPLSYAPRILLPVFREAWLLAAEGAAPDAVDAALRDWGFRTGPFDLAVELGPKLAARLAGAAATAFGDRLALPPSFPRVPSPAAAGRGASRSAARRSPSVAVSPSSTRCSAAAAKASSPARARRTSPPCSAPGSQRSAAARFVTSMSSVRPRSFAAFASSSSASVRASSPRPSSSRPRAAAFGSIPDLGPGLGAGAARRASASSRWARRGRGRR
jgi:3-hydroxyacyl-CoA dehydrogenase/enoyl-CoA hydratase/3-hydroxybutyryl-CoA epimerase